MAICGKLLVVMSEAIKCELCGVYVQDEQLHKIERHAPPAQSYRIYIDEVEMRLKQFERIAGYGMRGRKYRAR